ncbi:MAG TPA: hypothetical protein VL614_14505 [Acetobacteraceae bacterium]|jgi:hypothetical protein|nr:hypothetical protein [Acetobacteraceae bacterium]
MEPSDAASHHDSQQDDSAPAIPNNIAVLLHAARILLDYGRHLIDTVRHRATAPDFNAIAACFGTENLSTILAHLNRGILRAVALERVLLARAATGRDIDFVERRVPTPETERATETPSAQRRAPRSSRLAGQDDPELFMPTLQDLERQARRRPIGRSILDICLDLAVVPGFCHGQFWNELFDIMNYFGGSVDRLMRQKARRQQTFCQEQDRKPDSNWNWLRMKRDELRKVLGFFIGEPPVNPLDPAAAIATAPP